MATAIDIARLLDSDRAYWGGRRFVPGKRVTVQRIAIANQRGELPERIGEDFELQPAEVYAAPSYYFLHQEEIDRDVASYDAETEQIAKASREERA